MKEMRFLGLFMLWLCVIPSESQAATIAVPGDQPTIQDAIDAASDLDEIVVSPGTYLENIDLGGKEIILRSTAPTDPAVVASTIIDGGNSGPVVTFSGTETSDCLLTGFTITNGRSANGAGIGGHGTQATIVGNVISTNTVYSYVGFGAGLYDCDGLIELNTIAANQSFGSGGGMAACGGTIRSNRIVGNSSGSGGGLFDCDGLIVGNEISKNVAWYEGGGLYGCDGTIEDNTIADNGEWAGGGLSDCNGVIRGNRIVGNYSNDVFSGGGGLLFCDGIIDSNVISDNWAYLQGGGLSLCYGVIQNNIVWANSTGNLDSPDGMGFGAGLAFCDNVIVNNTIYGNSAAVAGGGIYSSLGEITNNIIWANSPTQIEDSSKPSHSCIQGWMDGGTGNLADPPEFVDADAGDFHLKPISRCIDAGAAVAGLNTDFEGDPRPYLFDSGARRSVGKGFDIGADEYVPGAGGDGPPVAEAGGPYTAAATSWDGAEVTLDGSASSSPNGDPLTFAWDLDTAVDSDGDGDPTNDADASGATPQAAFPIGQTEVSLVVTDSAGVASEPDTAVVTVGVTPVGVDVKPRSSRNIVVLAGCGLLPVAFLGSETFDVSTIDPHTVTMKGGDFANGLVKEIGRRHWPLAFYRDVNRDGRWDLVCFLEKKKLAQFDLGSVWEIGALTRDGFVVSGTDTVKLIRPGRHRWWWPKGHPAPTVGRFFGP